MADTYGPIFTIKLGTKKALVINNWEMAKECFTTNDIVVSSRPRLVAIDHLSYNKALIGFAPFGSYWREMRKITTSAFLSSHRIDLLSHVLVSIVQDSIKELFNVWSSAKKEHSYGFVLVELKQWPGEITFNIVRQCCIDHSDQQSEKTQSDGFAKGSRCLWILQKTALQVS
ncbi:hypothetical protein VNO77_23376 [Canavalia gladiata]|uniref:Uncharacterized protein n=1 Tax=Canavalia gladiata TaxID=3824 RepID=A0AAN9Q8V8_CANGL